MVKLDKTSAFQAGSAGFDSRRGHHKYWIGVTAARLALTQEVVVQIRDPVPYGPLVKKDKTPASQAGGVGFKSRRGHHYSLAWWNWDTHPV